MRFILRGRYITKIFLSALLFLCAGRTEPPATILPPAQGYGAWATHRCIRDSIANPAAAGMKVYLFSPDSVTTAPPVFFFFHGISATDPRAYMALISFCVSKGYAVVYPSYATTTAYTRPASAYRQMREGFFAAVKAWAGRLDTTRIGIIGHSYGGGAVPAMAYAALNEKGWGAAGAFMFIMAPWYSYDLTDEKLKSLPSNVKMIVEVFADDDVNDHRMAKDLFTTAAIPASEKDFIILFSDTSAGYAMIANHGTPTGELRFGPGVDFLDYYGVHRLIDALADYAFTGAPQAKNIALGNGGAEQRFMGLWPSADTVRPLEAGDTPRLLHPQNYYRNFWSHRMNPRAFTIHDSARVGHDITRRNYLRLSPLYRKMNAGESPAGRRDTTAGAIDVRDLKCYVAPPPAGWWGADGPYEPQERLFPHPGKGEANIHVITPHGLDTPAPVVLFAPAWWKPSTMFYRGFIDHIVSRGNVVIFSTYNMHRFLNQELRYEVLLEGFSAGVEMAADRIDTSRIAIVGHSYGGGAVPAIGWKYIAEKKWGSRGAALFIMSPWYAYNISQQQLQAFPSHVKLVVQTYEGNRKMDWRIAEDIFYNIGVHPSEKDYYFVSDAVNADCEIDADHDAPQSEDDDEINVIDYYAIWRILDALMDYSFTGSSEAKKVALGNGSLEQMYMGVWPDGTPVKALRVTDRPSTPHPQRSFLFQWKDRMNPRRRWFNPDE